MQESKQETQFRIGGVYFDQGHDLVRLTELTNKGRANGEIFCKQLGWRYYPARFNLDTGAWGDGQCYAGNHMCLIPGELHQVDGQWVPLDAAEDDSEHADPTGDVADMRDSPNAAMIARDGPAKPKTCTCGEPHSQGVIHRTDGPCYFKAQPSTTKPPIAGLTRVSAQDHRVGGWGFVR